MSGPFGTCWERIDRAQSHSETIAQTWNAFAHKEEEPPYEANAYVHDDGTGSIWVEQILPIPLQIPLLLGEFMYQLRATLDTCVYEAACLNTGQRPPPDENQLGFPICCKGRPQFDSSRRKIAPLTEQQRNIIESVQPYNAPELSPHHIPFNFNLGLGLLNEWARIDRHRKLHVAASWASNIVPLLQIPPGTRLVEFQVPHGMFMLKDQGVVATFRIEGWQHGMKVYANPNLTLDIVVDEVPLPRHDVDTLANRLLCMRKAVWCVVASIANTFGFEPP